MRSMIKLMVVTPPIVICILQCGVQLGDGTV